MEDLGSNKRLKGLAFSQFWKKEVLADGFLVTWPRYKSSFSPTTAAVPKEELQERLNFRG